MRANRVFKEKEAAAILRQALELQTSATKDASHTASQEVSYDELERVAAEAGIGESFLSQATARAAFRSRSGFLNLIEVTEKSVEGCPAIEDFAELAQWLAFRNRFGQVAMRTGPGLKGWMRIVGPSGRAMIYRGRAFSSRAEIFLEQGSTRISVRSSMAAAVVCALASLGLGALAALYVVTVMGSELGWQSVLTGLGVGAALFGAFTAVGVLQARALAEDLASSVRLVLSPKPQSLMAPIESPAELEQHTNA